MDNFKRKIQDNNLIRTNKNRILDQTDYLRKVENNKKQNGYKKLKFGPTNKY